MLLNRMCGGLDPINSSPSRVAIQGYDSVSYFTEGKAVQGYSAFCHEWMGATWRFSKSQHRDFFIADPEKYRPQYGGYCAFGISVGKLCGGDPTVWTIVEGKLYLNLNQDIAKIWEQDAQRYIKQADKKWPKLFA